MRHLVKMKLSKPLGALIFFTLLFSCCFNLSFRAQHYVTLKGMEPPQTMPQLVPFRDGKFWGYCDTSGKMIITPKFREAFFFVGKLAVSTTEDSSFVFDTGNPETDYEPRYHIINKQGEKVTGNQYLTEKNSGLFLDMISDTAALIVGSEKFIIDINKKKYPLDQYSIVNYSKAYGVPAGLNQSEDVVYRGAYGLGRKNDLCYVLDGKGKSLGLVNCDSLTKNGYYNSKKELVILPGGVEDFYSGFAYNKNGKGYPHFIDKTGNDYTCRGSDLIKIKTISGSFPSPLKNGVAILYKGELPGVMDSSLKIIVPFGKYKTIEDFYDGMAKFTTETTKGFVSSKGVQLIVNEKDGQADNFSDGVSRMEKHLMDKRGEKIKLSDDYEYDESRFSNGLLRVKNKRKYAFVNRSGKLVLNLKTDYDEVDVFSEELCRVSKDGKYGFINKKGEEVIPPSFDYVNSFSNGLATLSAESCVNCYLQIINYSGNKMPCQFKPYDEWINGFRLIYDSKTGKKGVINSSAKIVIPVEYETITLYPCGLANAYNKKWGYINLFTGRKYFKD